MFLSIFLAKVIGLYLIIIGAFYIYRKDDFKPIIEDWLRHPAISMTGGALALIIGLLLVISHNVWVAGWPVVITIIGYLSLIKGLWRLFLPETGTESLAKALHGTTNIVIGIICLVIGIWLAYEGFFAYEGFTY